MFPLHRSRFRKDCRTERIFFPQFPDCISAKQIHRSPADIQIRSRIKISVRLAEITSGQGAEPVIARLMDKGIKTAQILKTHLMGKTAVKLLKHEFRPLFPDRFGGVDRIDFVPEFPCGNRRFSGKVTEDPQTITIRITPREMKDEVAFRFSRKLGVVDKDDLAGEPFYLSITDLGTVPRPAAEEGGKNKKELEGVAYNVPGRAQVTLVQGNETLFDDELPITQFGGIEYLAPVLFNKNTVTKVQFDTTTGGLLKIEREAKE